MRSAGDHQRLAADEADDETNGAGVMSVPHPMQMFVQPAYDRDMEHLRKEHNCMLCTVPFFTFIAIGALGLGLAALLVALQAQSVTNQITRFVTDPPGGVIFKQADGQGVMRTALLDATAPTNASALPPELLRFGARNYTPLAFDYIVQVHFAFSVTDPVTDLTIVQPQQIHAFEINSTSWAPPFHIASTVAGLTITTTSIPEVVENPPFFRFSSVISGLAPGARAFGIATIKTAEVRRFRLAALETTDVELW